MGKGEGSGGGGFPKVAPLGEQPWGLDKTDEGVVGTDPEMGSAQPVSD